MSLRSSARLLPDGLRDALIAEQEIRRQLDNYCRAVDRFDLELLKSIWHSDGTLEYEDGELCGKAVELADRLIQDLREYASHSHQITNVLITVTGDQAVSETYEMAMLRSHPEVDGHYLDTHRRGRFLDRWAKREGRWAIEHRQAVSTVGWKHVVADGRLAAGSRRDREDPVYELWAYVGEPSTWLPPDLPKEANRV